jgi:hypothetical protein
MSAPRRLVTMSSRRCYAKPSGVLKKYAARWLNAQCSARAILLLCLRLAVERTAES